MQGVGPVLDPGRPVHGVVVLGDVAGGEDPGHAGLQVAVAHDAVVDREPARTASSVRGTTPIPTMAKSQSKKPTVGRPHPLDRAVALERVHARAEHHLHAVIEVDVAVHGAELRAQDPLQRDGGGLDDRDVEPALAGGRRRLRADPARADDTTLPPRSRRARIASELSTLRSSCTPSRSAPGTFSLRGGARGEQQPVEGQPLTAGERDLRRAASRSTAVVSSRSSMSCAS